MENLCVMEARSSDNLRRTGRYTDALDHLRAGLVLARTSGYRSREISALNGTKVVLHVETDQPIRGGALILRPAGKPGVRVPIQPSSLALLLEPDC